MDYQGIILFICLGYFVYLVIRFITRPSNSYEGRIKKELEVRRFELVEIQNPGYLNVGPFPKIEVRIMFLQTSFLGFSGESVRYRIVKYKNKSGLLKESWVKIETIAFQISEINWLPDLDE